MDDGYQGIAASGGIAIGNILRIESEGLLLSEQGPRVSAAEKLRFRDAVQTFDAKTRSLAKRVGLSVGEKEAAILEAQIVVLHDKSMQGEMEKLIDMGYSAEYAVDDVSARVYRMFEGIEDKVIKGRSSDITDIRMRLLHILRGLKDIDFADIRPGTILVTEDLTPSQASRIVKGRVLGIVAERGSRTSHAAILARAIGIPAVFGVADALIKAKNGEPVIVDGSLGQVFFQPDGALVASYEEKQASILRESREIEQFKGKATKTADGKHLLVYSNLGLLSDTEAALDPECEGVGLFRTEILFMEKTRMPDENEQFLYYRSVLERMEGRNVTIRTLDVGGEKNIPYLHLDREENPYLGYRGVRYSLGHLADYRTQLRALLRASAYGKLSIMIPMLTCVDELRSVKDEIETVKRELREKGIPFDENVRVGVMIETASAALIADMLAKECDFFSIGTNDLIQYTMSVDRGNPGVEYLYSVFQPAVLRLIRGVIAAANGARIPVGLCGEAASDELMIPILIAFGLDIFSVSPRSVLPVRRAIANWSTEEAGRVSAHVMELDTQSEIIDYLKGL